MALYKPALQFLGTGSCFNTSLGNTSAFYFDDSTSRLLLIDCGETVFERIKELSVFEKAQSIDILITHLHTDHVGSLPSLIFYCHFVKKIIPTIVFEDTGAMRSFLNIVGVEKALYNLTSAGQYKRYSLYPVFQQHTISLNSYGYCMTIEGKKIYFSGDCSSISRWVVKNYITGIYDEFYQDVTRFKSPTHINIERLAQMFPLRERNTITCMHFDDIETKSMARGLGFNVATSIFEESL